MSDILAGQIATPTPFPGTETKTIEEMGKDLADEAGHINNRASIISDDAVSVQLRAFAIQLDERTARLAKKDPAELLNDLSGMGFAWRDIARMVGVTVPAVRRWRNGEIPSGENRRQIAQLLAFSQIIRDDHFVFEPASWMEIRIVGAAPLTPIDLYEAGNLNVVYKLAADKITPEAALDEIDPQWRERYRSDWEVATADDGERYIRLKTER